jgi:DNA-binding NarL/FixJ family response regulator
MPPQPATLSVFVAETDSVMAAYLVAALGGPEFVVTALAVGEAADLNVAALPSGGVVVFGPSLATGRHAHLVPMVLSRGLRVLVTSAEALNADGAALLLAGASGFVVLDAESPVDLREAVAAVGSGGSALHPTVVDEVLRQWRTSTSARKDGARVPDLTPREREVLVGLNDGLTSRMLATRLGVAEKTIEAHKSRLYAKIGARNQAHAVRIAADLGLM